MKKFFRRFGNIIYPMISLAIVFLLWFVISKIVDIELIIPSIKTTFVELGKLFSEKNFYLAILNTTWRSLFTFVLSLFCGIFCSILSATFPIFEKIFTPIMRFLRAVPTISIILLVVVWLDNKFAPIIVAFLIVFPIVYSNMFDAIIGINPNYITLCKTYKVSKKDVIKSLYIPLVLPNFFDTARTTISLTIKIIISAEVLAQTKQSMGIMMQISKASLETPTLLAWTLIAIILSYFLEIIVTLIKKSVIRWQK